MLDLFAKDALFLQSSSQSNNFRVIDEQHRNCYPADLCPALQFRALPTKVISPLVCSRMKEANEFARLWIPASNVGAFEAVTMHAGEGKVRLLSCASVLAGDDVIDLKWRRMCSRG